MCTDTNETLRAQVRGHERGAVLASACPTAPHRVADLQQPREHLQHKQARHLHTREQKMAGENGLTA